MLPEYPDVSLGKMHYKFLYNLGARPLSLLFWSFVRTEKDWCRVKLGGLLSFLTAVYSSYEVIFAANW